jgi:branched-chain amino acid transport system permease protein
MKQRGILGGFILLGGLLAIPHVITDTYILHMLILATIWVTLATHFNVILSTGQLSLAQIAFFGIGAYTSGLLTVKLNCPFILAIIAAGVLASLVGLLIGRITLKMRGAHFILVTFAFSEICRLVARNWVELTNGPMGLRGIPFPNIRIPGVLEVEFMSYTSQYYMALGLALVSVYVAYRLRYSLFGRASNALRTSEALAESVGISHYKYVILAVVVSTFFTGVAGGFYAHYVTLVSPEIFSFAYMISLLMMVIGGGRNSVTGPVIGAMIFTLLPELMRAFAVYRMLIFGALLTLTVIFLPEGITPQILAIWRKITQRHKNKGSGPQSSRTDAMDAKGEENASS